MIRSILPKLSPFRQTTFPQQIRRYISSEIKTNQQIESKLNGNQIVEEINTTNPLIRTPTTSTKVEATEIEHTGSIDIPNFILALIGCHYLTKAYVLSNVNTQIDGLSYNAQRLHRMVPLLENDDGDNNGIEDEPSFFAGPLNLIAQAHPVGQLNYSISNQLQQLNRLYKASGDYIIDLKSKAVNNDINSSSGSINNNQIDTTTTKKNAI